MSRASGIPYGQPARVHDWCFREQTLGEAITTLLRYHQTLPLTASFGPGTTSPSDGMRFGASASVLGARHLPRYFGVHRGLSVYSHVSDQGPQLSVAVINCQLREATFVLDGLAHQESYPIAEPHRFAWVHGSRLRALRVPRVPIRPKPAGSPLTRSSTGHGGEATTVPSRQCCAEAAGATSSLSTGTT